MVYPKCENERISKVSYRLCKNAEKPCREAILSLYGGHLPPFLRCNNETIFTSPSGNCEADDINNPRRRFISYNKINSTCLTPYLKETEELPFYSNFDGCGLSCSNDPSFTSDTRIRVRSWILGCSAIGIIVGLFAFVTQILKYREKKGRQSGRVFDCIFLVRSFAAFTLPLGMSLASADVTCSKDGTLIMSQFQINGCLSSFMLIYFSIHVALTCQAFLGFYLYYRCRSTTSQVDQKPAKKNVFILLSIALVPSIILYVFAIHYEGYGGEALLGICYLKKESALLLADTIIQTVYVLFAFTTWLMFTLRMGKKKMFWFSIYLLTSCLLDVSGIAYSAYR